MYKIQLSNGVTFDAESFSHPRPLPVLLIHTHAFSIQDVFQKLAGAEALTVSFFYFDRTMDYPDFVPGKTYYERVGREEYDFVPTLDTEMQPGKIYYDRVDEPAKTYTGYTEVYLVQKSIVGNHPNELQIGLQKPDED